MRASLFIASSAAALSFAAAGAAEPDRTETVVVTANRAEAEARRVGDSVTVIDPETVRASQKTTVSDLLGTTPGVIVSRNGGLGNTTSLYIRGAETDQTVVLIDGVKVNDPSTAGGGLDFAHLLTDEVSRIEVLRGPQSTLWGSQAIGGVVNLVSTRPEGPVASAVSLEGGSRETARLRARVESGGDRVSWRLGGSYLTTEGISSFDRALGGRERDGYRNVSGNARAWLRLNETVSADLRATYWQGRSEFDGFPPPDFVFTDTPEYGWTKQWIAYAGIHIAAFGGRLKNRIAHAYTDTNRENFDPASVVRKTFDGMGRNARWEYQGTLELAPGYQAVFGLESERSKLRTSAPTQFDPDPVPLAREVQLDSAYAQLSVTPIDALTLTAGLRRDDHDTFGGHTTGRAALAWSIVEGTTLRASFGEGFKSPTLYQLFSEYGNTLLQPEEAAGWDAGIERHFGGDSLVLSATYFERRTTEQIDFISCFGSADPRCAARPFGFFDNLQRTKADGVELAASARIGERLSFSANYTYTNARNAVPGGPNFGRELARRARNVANAEASYQWPAGYTTSVAVQRVGRSFDDAANSVPLDAYTLVDLRVTRELSERLEVFGRIENLLDEHYRTAGLYGSPDRGVFAGLRYGF